MRRLLLCTSALLLCAALVTGEGTLLLCMLTKNEEANLDRTLPHWAPLISAWVIGIDRHNTDNSTGVIHRHVGHIPGETVVVDFDGMGTTWSRLVKVGIERFPNVTHGIVSDADFKPLYPETFPLVRSQLDPLSSKHMYVIQTPGTDRTQRRMDWIYRNLPGARVARRVHQTVYGPSIPDAHPMTVLDLTIEEQPGGYQDRTGRKFHNYIEQLEQDLRELPDDARTLYYLGHAHWDIFLSHSDAPSAEDWSNLTRSREYFARRAANASHIEGYEERFFAMLKLGEMEERFFRNYTAAIMWWERARDADPVRAEPWFYIGQHHRLQQNYPAAVPWLTHASRMPMPDRSLFQWQQLYDCLAETELARAVTPLNGALDNSSMASDALAALRGHRCDPRHEKDAIAEIERAIELLDQRTRPVGSIDSLLKRARMALMRAGYTNTPEELGKKAESCRQVRLAAAAFDAWAKKEKIKKRVADKARRILHEQCFDE